jgi:hypothetical protein
MYQGTVNQAQYKRQNGKEPDEVLDVGKADKQSLECIELETHIGL